MKTATPTQDSNEISLDDIERALRANGGRIPVTAQSLNMPLKALETIVRENVELQTAIVEAQEIEKDKVELDLVQQATTKSQASKLYLETLAADRGWGVLGVDPKILIAITEGVKALGGDPNRVLNDLLSVIETRLEQRANAVYLDD